MRHGKKFNHLGRKSSHRQALLKNMAISLITHKRINTTLAKAKALRRYIEPLLTKSKDNTTHNRRVVFSYLQSKEAVTELFGPIAEKIATRPGGYVRVLRTGFRWGDNAEMGMIELVDFNELRLAADGDGAAKAGRRRRKKKKEGESNVAAPVATKEEVAAAPVVEEEAPEVEDIAADEAEENTSEEKNEEQA